MNLRIHTTVFWYDEAYNCDLEAVHEDEAVEDLNHRRIKRKKGRHRSSNDFSATYLKEVEGEGWVIVRQRDSWKYEVGLNM